MSYIGQRPVVGRYIKLDQISSGFNGSETSFSMTAGSQAVFPGTARNLLLSLGGVIQEPDTNFTISGSTLTFTTAPVANTTFFAVIFGDMQSTGTPSDGTVLPASIASSGNFSFPQLTVTGTSSLGDDVTFTGANYNVVWDKSDNALEFADNAKAIFGTGSDFELFHDGTNSVIRNNTGGIFIKGLAGGGNTIYMQPINNANSAVFNPGGAVELYYDNSQKFRTESAGIVVSGNVRVPFDNHKIILGASQDLKIYHDGSHSYIEESGTGKLRILTSELLIGNPADDENIAKFIENGAVELYHDNSKRFETLSSGVKITGLNATGSSVLGDFRFKDQDDNLDIHYDAENNKIVFHDNNKATFGTGDDLQLFHDGSNSYITNATGTIHIQGKSGENSIRTIPDAAVELYYDNTKRLETTSVGAKVTGRLGVDKGPTTKLNAELSVFAATGNDDASDWGADGIFQLDHTGTNAVNNEVLMLGAVSGGVGQIASGFGFGRESTSNWGTYISFKTHSTSTSNIDELIERWRITSAGHFENNSDSIRIKLGASDDLQIYHDGSNSHIEEGGTGALLIKGDGVSIGATSGEFYFRGFENGSSLLRYDNSTKLETTSDGVQVSGSKLTLEDSSGAVISFDESGTRKAFIGIRSFAAHDGDGIMIQTSETAPIKFAINNVIKAKLDSNGDFVPGSNNASNLGTSSNRWSDVYIADDIYLNDGGVIRFGTSGSDMLIQHTGNNNFIEGGSGFSGNLYLRAKLNENGIILYSDGAAELYYDNSKKFETSSTGVTVTGGIRASGYDAISTTPYTYRYGRGNQGGGLSVYAAESAIEVVSTEDGTHGGSFLLRTVDDGAGFVYNPTDNALELKSFTPSADDFSIHGSGTNLSRLDTQLRAVKDGAVELYYDNVKKLNTSSGGIEVAGTVYFGQGHAVNVMNRESDGTLLEFKTTGTARGSISVSGNTVSYNGGHLSRWSQIKGLSSTDKSARPTIYKGTVMSNLDDLCVWKDKEPEQLNMTKISDTEGDKDVAGVFWAWDEDNTVEVNDFYVSMTGDMVIRVAASITVARGDLLISAGDGTAKPQADDIVRSSTIAKITSTTSTATYADGSKAYPCVLMAC